jgi:hypothetical protein
VECPEPPRKPSPNPTPVSCFTRPHPPSSRTFFVVDADPFTRRWYSDTLGVELAGAQGYPSDQVDAYRTKFGLTPAPGERCTARACACALSDAPGAAAARARARLAGLRQRGGRRALLRSELLLPLRLGRLHVEQQLQAGVKAAARSGRRPAEIGQPCKPR